MDWKISLLKKLLVLKIVESTREFGRMFLMLWFKAPELTHCWPWNVFWIHGQDHYNFVLTYKMKIISTVILFTAVKADIYKEWIHYSGAVQQVNCLKSNTVTGFITVYVTKLRLGFNVKIWKSIISLFTTAFLLTQYHTCVNVYGHRKKASAYHCLDTYYSYTSLFLYRLNSILIHG